MRGELGRPAECARWPQEERSAAALDVCRWFVVRNHLFEQQNRSPGIPRRRCIPECAQQRLHAFRVKLFSGNQSFDPGMQRRSQTLIQKIQLFK